MSLLNFNKNTVNTEQSSQVIKQTKLARGGSSGAYIALKEGPKQSTLQFKDLGFPIPPSKEQPEGSNHGNKGPGNENSFANYTQFEESDRVRQANRSNHHGVDYQMRKLKIPLFDGDDSHGWIYKVERYFEVQDIQPREQLRAAVLCMKGQALSWFRLSEARSPFRSWEGLKGRLLERFQLSQEGTLGHGGNFIKGLRLELRSAVRVMQPEGLNHAMKLAIMIDDNKLDGVVGKSALKPPTGGTMRVEFTTDQVQHV
nr:ankyrin repeat-containing protein [Tanacetum cinerariifolium]